jgi:hypothetical protein
VIDLAKIRVLYRKPLTLALYGIPYEMRPGQSPRDIERGVQEARDHWYRLHPSAKMHSPFPTDFTAEWIWLGSPGWWGEISAEDRTVIEPWIRGLGDLVPTFSGEWSMLPA